MAFLKGIECDACENRVEYNGVISNKVLAKLARKTYGWSIGKYHLCDECKKSKLAKEIARDNKALADGRVRE